MNPMEQREVYPNAPVVLVALEIRHPTAEPLTGAQRNVIKRRLGPFAPIMRATRIQQMTFVTAAGAPGAVAGDHSQEFPRYFSRDNTLAVSLRDDAIVLETTRYGRWEQLRGVLSEILQARQDIGGIDGVERVGLRYIDEIRVPSDPQGWGGWVDTSLLGPAPIADELGLPIAEWQGIAVFNPGPEHAVVLRYGPREGYAVDPGGDVKRPTPPPGPFFLMDIDSFWIPSEGTPDFDIKMLSDRCDGLHAPVRGLFERLITERLREEVFRHGN